MIAGLLLENLPSRMLQTLAIATVGAALPKIFRLQHPPTQLLYGHVLLALCLLLPLLQPWRHVPIARLNTNPAVVPSRAAVSGAQPARQPVPRTAVPVGYKSFLAQGVLDRFLLWILGIGVVARLGWLLIGLWQIRNCRIRSTPVYPIPEAVKAASALTHADALICMSPDAYGPVTLGWLAPVVLLPDAVLALNEEALCSIVCHELLHVKRHDWLIAVFEELAGCLLCFNPAAWWLLAQTRLAREQLVDAEVVRLTEAREPYIDSLLSIARAGSVLDLAPAPLFLRKRHLTQRLYLLLKEVSMSNRLMKKAFGDRLPHGRGSVKTCKHAVAILSRAREQAVYCLFQHPAKTRLLSSYGSIALMVVAAGWLACVSFPLIGQPQAVLPQSALAGPVQGLAEPFGVLQGNHYHHNLTGVEFDVPSGWSLGLTRTVDGDAREMTVFHDPDAKSIFASVFMAPANTPETSIAGALSRAIPQLLQRRAGATGVHAARNYKIRAGSVEQTWIGGHQAVQAIGEYQLGDQNMAELLTWIYTEHTRTFFFAKTTADELEFLRIPYQQMLESAKIP